MKVNFDFTLSKLPDNIINADILFNSSDPKSLLLKIYYFPTHVDSLQFGDFLALDLNRIEITEIHTFEIKNIDFSNTKVRSVEISKKNNYAKVEIDRATILYDNTQGIHKRSEYYLTGNPIGKTEQSDPFEPISIDHPDAGLI